MIYTAIDVGASSGRIMVGELNEGKLDIQEIHRFANGFSQRDGHCLWDIDHLLKQILQGLQKVKTLGYEHCTVGIDTWAVDYVLLDEKGDRLREAISYRDRRTDHTIDKLEHTLSKAAIYQKTGIQFQPFNTIYQLFEEDRELLKKTDKIMMIPDYLGYCLTGKAVTEITNVSTTQLLNVSTGNLDPELLEAVSVLEQQFAPLTEPGCELGKLRNEWFPDYDLPACKVMTVATHDTASAVIAAPGVNDGWAYISSGTWSLIGVENKTPIITDLALENNYTNERGANNTIRFLKNIIGMWVIQEVKQQLQADYSFQQLAEEAKKTEPFQQFINLNDKRFLNPENMIKEIQHYCRQTRQKIPRTAGELACCIYSNLAIIYAIAIKELETITEKPIEQFHIIGGGARNDFLNQLTADMSGKAVYAGPIEATATGNLLMQMIAAKEVKDIKEARQVVRNSFPIKVFTPKDIDRSTIIQSFQQTVLKALSK
ncbi:rhamnulokinase [Bacillus subtilis subsp. subtilis]|uniref:Rhamnulokinase n=3 Tax=Bacillus subtilis subsp. subtilis TaxID=135461 RepID=RHAB_BACSU|nr:MULTISPECIES: rhamnulokinase [Bacillales]NP_390998.1 rhamnulokinase [Bacillus subtilis subsp. subtilis str. 168]O05262.1 RecName: Full=Rhamnulokinase; Short=RhaB; AltName: Full=ATP:L-rhamnulose phosphotransferase; AltName: Full=L-rhamnulose 1-kinase; AltName: Full=Rhamnulose kinase [Bacillus subtilis subsp. subtilis str. 168]AOL30870.1 rhamnulokinase [Alkalicoccobacillus gibsonii]BAM55186.1 rhamnulokinase [Bacillus subtilis BEST7613]AFQ58963.1 Rhamnulokinase [Bacillus subtilis QB928]AGG625